ncbi:TetR/AcrR family transcriptional regulator [Halalkalibacter sp. APA_J-10(15)]|uniref:TetR/AcrR family transcriptional regulator n=1 Tax=unclassified Halalkalibacter TaxID=2893063 RepID=UPI001FF334A3|nr:TetR/AcrR family transcriptional regulator [Halalkalibacter sp. APA_J-10(15)]MCK0471176.1 TetR/AcrR family transcriptional regulator [Halalkalibacter sp. APA_J-10(15)]
MTASRSPARQRVLEVASGLFYREGIRAVGVDTIAEQAGVAKTTLYRHFPTKNDLIVAYLEEQDRIHWQHFDEAIAEHEGSPKAQLLALIDATAAELLDPEYHRGCTFLNALAEFSEENHPAHRLALEYNRALRLRLSRLSQQLAVDDESLTDQLLLVINGALSSVPVFGFDGPAARLKTMARQVVDRHLENGERKR